MPEALVEVGMDLIGDGKIFLGQLYFFLIPCELGQGALGTLLRRIVVRVRDIGYGDALRAMVPADPVCVGEVDADGGGRIAVAGEAGCVDDLCADSLHLRLLETRVDRGVVLEPLRVCAEDVAALGCLVVLDIHKGLPGALAGEGIVVVLDETVHEVHGAEGVP